LDNVNTSELVLLEDLLGEMHRHYLRERDSYGIQFKVNTEERWEKTIGLRCNHILLDSLDKYLRIVTSGLLAGKTPEMLFRASINLCYRELKGGGMRIPDETRRTLYVTLKPSEELYRAVLELWPNEKYIHVSTLIGQLRKWMRPVNETKTA